jgi:hypothetical protein
MLAKKTSKNQITLPKAITKQFPDTVYFDVTLEEDRIMLKPVKITPLDSTLVKVRTKMNKLGITEKEIEEAVIWARKRVR